MASSFYPYADCRMIKIVAIGDYSCGKTTLLISFTTQEFPEEYVPTVFDNFDTVHVVDGKQYNISLVDTAGQEDYDEIRQMAYEDCDVVLCCFSCHNGTSLNSCESKHIPEARTHLYKNPIVLVGTNSDREHWVSDERIVALARRCGCVAYCPCSARTFEGLDEVFSTAIRAHLAFVESGKRGVKYVGDSLVEDEDPEEDDRVRFVEEFAFCVQGTTFVLAGGTSLSCFRWWNEGLFVL